ncbi:MAG TPA: LacI family DNA-binding transcriptional regulator [Opitutaceae bacterium]|nr:LacI family DNA-binding transcriptional regulator [Opitutaceae bacterium]
MSKPVTMKAIAEQAGVTQATVSMSLAGNRRIPPATRGRIQAIAQKLGYRPNAYISALMRIRRQGRPHNDRPVLALVNSLDRAAAWREHVSPAIRQMREGAIERATERGYRAQEFWLYQQGMTQERFSEMLRARGIQGLLLGPMPDNPPVLRLKWDYFAVVALVVPQPQLALTTVCNDHYFSTLQAIRECHSRGYRRPGLIMHWPHRERFQGRWNAGYLVARHLLPGLRLVKPLFFDDHPKPVLLQRWLKSEKPDVIVSAAIGDSVQAMLTRMGWRIPDDIGLVWLSCPELGHPISGIYQNSRLIGATGMDTLISMVERNERGLPAQASTVMLEGLWNPGQTL